MKLNLNTDQQIIPEPFSILTDHLEVAKIRRFWENCHLRKGAYSDIKEQLFKSETVDSLYDKIKAYKDSQ